MCVLIFSTIFAWKISHSKKNEQDMVKNVYCSSYKVPFILVRFQWNVSFLDRFSQHPHISNFMKIRPVEAELFHADGQTDGHNETKSRFSQFCERAWKRRPNALIGIPHLITQDCVWYPYDDR